MIEVGLVIIAAVIADIALGEPPRRIHPTVMMGKIIGHLVVASKRRAGCERAYGVIITLGTSAIFSVPFVLLYVSASGLETWLYTILIAASGIVALNVTVSIRSMLQHVAMVTEPLRLNNITVAQQRLATVVKRKTSGLDSTHILSGLVETIAENTVDGIISPLSYFALAGPAGAFAYRAVNTIDAMIGYKTSQLQDIGWFGAGCDRVLNYIPARITAVLIVLAAVILRLDWRGALFTTRRDHAKTSSPNAGYPMAAMAGALGVRLEKVGHYVIGDGSNQPTIQSVHDANRVMMTCVGLYVSAILALVIGVGTLWWYSLV